MYEQNELYHHGIKGQKWYVRRFQNEDGTLTALGKARRGYQFAKTAYSDYKIRRAVKTGNVKRLNDDELKRAIERIAQEKKFRDLQKDTRFVSKGRSIVGDILANGARTIGNKAFQKLADKIFEEKESADDRILRESKIATAKTNTVKQKILLDEAEKQYAKIEKANAEQKRSEKEEKEANKQNKKWLKDYLIKG